MITFKDKKVLITGAASGLGRALAEHLLEKEAKLILIDLNELNFNHKSVLTFLFDVSIAKSWVDLKEQLDSMGIEVDIVFNCAATSLVDSFVDLDEADFRRVMDVNFWGYFYGCKTFLPDFKKLDKGVIVNIISINALLPSSYNSAYNVSKMAIKGLTESLMVELLDTNIKVFAVYPGGIKTDILRNTKFVRHYGKGIGHRELVNLYDKFFLKLDPQQAANVIIREIYNGNQQVLVGIDAKIIYYVHKFFPVKILSWAQTKAKKIFNAC